MEVALRKCGGRLGENLEKECLIIKSMFNYTGLIKMISSAYKVDLHFLQNAGRLIYK